MAFNEITCTSCTTHHSAGRYVCDACEVTFSEMGIRHSYRYGNEQTGIRETSMLWQHCPICGVATGLPRERTTKVVYSVEQMAKATAEYDRVMKCKR